MSNVGVINDLTMATYAIRRDLSLFPNPGEHARDTRSFFDERITRSTANRFNQSIAI
jgi:hypothetical protein